PRAMSPRFAFALALATLATLAHAPRAAAHAEHYGQSAYVTVGPARVTVELELGPGALVAAAIVRRIDGDGDGVIAPAEARAYASAVGADLAVTVDGKPVPLRVTDFACPPAAILATGEAVMRWTGVSAAPL